jgi:acyl transferase domain-containing protein
MIAVGLSVERIQPFFKKLKIAFGQHSVGIACYNSPQSLTISGDKDQVNILRDMLEIEQVFVRKLKVNVAYHSSHMSGIASQYFDLIQGLEIGSFPLPQNPTMVSSVTGAVVDTKSLLDGNYWVNNLVSPVNFSAAFLLACSSSEDSDHRDTTLVDDFLEIGPHSALQAPVREILRSADRFEHISYDSILIRNQSAADTLLDVVGRLHCSGYSVDLSKVNRPSVTGSQRPRVLTNLPEYTFDHSKTYWSEHRLSKAFRFRKHPRLDLLGTPMPESTSFEMKWRHTFKISELPWMEDHKVHPSQLAHIKFPLI